MTWNAPLGLHLHELEAMLATISINVTRKEDNTLPTGPVERTIEYVAPFTHCDRETDYATVWTNLDAKDC
jgi:hypothetical protein